MEVYVNTIELEYAVEEIKKSYSRIEKAIDSLENFNFPSDTDYFDSTDYRKNFQDEKNRLEGNSLKLIISILERKSK